jgi:hypothetical protein
MRPSARFLIAPLLAAAATSASADGGAAAWQAEQQAHARASVAQQALSDRYTAIWTSLDPSQKARFSAQERAWLNAGREREQQACIASRGARTDLVAKTCEAEVLEKHLGTLGTAQRIAASS